MDSLSWLKDLFTTNDSVAHIALLYAIVIATGVYLGKIKVGGISLGVTFVLFAGIVAGHIGFTAPAPILTFVQDFGLILFVFMIGMQVGPGFFESFGTTGIKLNGLATLAIVLNVLVRSRHEHARSGCCQRSAELRIRLRQCTTDCLGLCLRLPLGCVGHYRSNHPGEMHL